MDVQDLLTYDNAVQLLGENDEDTYIEPIAIPADTRAAANRDVLAMWITLTIGRELHQMDGEEVNNPAILWHTRLVIRTMATAHVPSRFLTLSPHAIDAALLHATSAYPGGANGIDWDDLLESLLEAVTEALDHFDDENFYGDDANFMFDEIGGEVHLTVDPDFGGCSTTQPTVHLVHAYGADKGLSVNIMSLRSSNNNCAIRCVLYGFDRLHFTLRRSCLRLTGADGDKCTRAKFMRAKFIRTACNLPPTGPLNSTTHMSTLAIYLEVTIHVFNLEMEEIHVSPNVSRCHVFLMLDGRGVYDNNSGVGHYFAISSPEFRVSTGKGGVKRNRGTVACPKCCRLKTLGHFCQSVKRARGGEEGKDSDSDASAESGEEEKEITQPLRSSTVNTDEVGRTALEKRWVTEARADAATALTQLKKAFFDDGLHILMHGPGGAGKSWLLGELETEMAERPDWGPASFVKLTPTGISAVAIRGTTFHSWLELGKDATLVSSLPNSVLLERLLKNPHVRHKVELLRAVATDEISMMSAKLFQLLELLFKACRNSGESMGGVQFIFSGDMLQLPTINAAPFYRAPAWSEVVPDLAVFNRRRTLGHRILEVGWARALEGVRTATMSPRTLRLLNTRNFASVDEALVAIKADGSQACELSASQESEGRFDNFTAIVPLNRQRRRIIKAAWNMQLPSHRVTFQANDSCSFDNRTERRFAVQRNVMLYKGADVICTGTNSLRAQYGVANGTMGVVVSWGDAHVRVRFSGLKAPLDVERHKFTVKARGSDVVYVRHQFPLEMSIARTVHKVQSCTLVKPLIIICESSFENSQLYVAMSRARTSKQVYLVGFRPCQVSVERGALDFENWCLAMDYELSQTDPSWAAPALCAYPTLTADPDILEQSSSSLFRSDAHHQVVQRMFPYRDGNRVQKGMLARKTMYYDLETLFDGVREVAYYNFIIYACTGSDGTQYREESKEFCALCEPALRGKVVEATANWILERVIAERNAYMLARNRGGRQKSTIRNLEKPIFLCAYNGSGFDFHFLLRQFMHSLSDPAVRDRFMVRPVMKGGKIIMMSLWDVESESQALVIHDLCQITQCALSKASIEYLNDDGLAKGVFPHMWVTDNIETFYATDRSATVSIPLEGFPKFGHHRRMAKELHENKAEDFDLAKYPIHEILHEYGPQDVKILKALYKVVDDLCLEETGASILNFKTLSQYTWYGAMKYLDKSLIAPNPRMDGELESSMRQNHKHTRLFTFTRSVDTDTSSAVSGGKVYPRALRWTSPDVGKPYDEIKDYYVYADIVSMYPWAMTQCDYPVGEWVRVTGEAECQMRRRAWLYQWRVAKDIDKNPDFPLELLDVTITLNPCDLEPPVGRQPRPGKSGLKWDVGAEHRRWLTSVDLWLILSSGGVLGTVHQFITFTSRGKPYEPWVTRCFANKAKAQLEGHTAKRAQSKTLANACYGTTLKRDFDNVVVAVSSMAQLTRFHNDFLWLETLNWQELHHNKRLPGGPTPGTLLLSGERFVWMDHEVSKKPRYHGAFVLSWSRYILNKMMRDINPDSLSGSVASIKQQVLYGDTDSFMFHCSAIPRMMKYFGSEMGDLSDELAHKNSEDWKEGKFVKIVDFASRRPKWYGLRAVRPDGSIKETVKMASINVPGAEYIYPDGTVREGLDFDGFKFLCDDHSGEDSEKIRVIMANRMLRCGIRVARDRAAKGNVCFDLYRGSLSRTIFKTFWKGRRILDRAPGETGAEWTVPHGWVSKN